MTLGLEAAGTVEAVGAGVRGFKPGDRVQTFAWESTAEYALGTEQTTFPIPDSMTFEDAASIGVTFLTSWDCLVPAGRAKAGESVLVHAAGSGCGVAAIQIAKHLGLRVLTTASTDDKLQKAKALGADEVINYASSDFVAETMRLTGGQGVDLVLDGIGGDTLLRSLQCLRFAGRLISYGKAAGHEDIPFDPAVLWGKSLSIVGVSVAGFDRRPFRDLLDLFRDRKLKAVVDKVYTLEQAASAHHYLEHRKVFGKVVLKL
jgi:NADPH2:quinone reductase